MHDSKGIDFQVYENKHVMVTSRRSPQKRQTSYRVKHQVVFGPAAGRAVSYLGEQPNVNSAPDSIVHKMWK
jgi:hypothetical protein